MIDLKIYFFSGILIKTALCAKEIFPITSSLLHLRWEIYKTKSHTKTWTPKRGYNLIYVVRLSTIFSTVHKKSWRVVWMGFMIAARMMQFTIQLDWNMGGNPQHRILMMGSITVITIKSHKTEFQAIPSWYNDEGSPHCTNSKK